MVSTNASTGLLEIGTSASIANKPNEVYTTKVDREALIAHDPLGRAHRLRQGVESFSVSGNEL